MIRLEELTKVYAGRRSPAVDDLDLEVRDGEVLGLVGLNGAGKTTTIRMGVGLMRPTRGTIEIDGIDLATHKRRASAGIGWVPELFPFEPSARGIDLLAYYAGFHGMSRAEARSRAREVLEEVSLEGAARDRIRTYSQGMRRRFGIAAAMLHRPQNLLLDEVLNGLDPAGVAYVRSWTSEQRGLGKAVLLSSHLLTELEAVADRVAFVHRGRLLSVASRAEIAGAARPALQISVENPDAALPERLATWGSVRGEGDTFHLLEPNVPASEVIASLVEHGYRLREVRAERESLETYFFRLLEGAT